MTPDKKKKLCELLEELKKIRDEKKKREFVKGGAICSGTLEDLGKAQDKEKAIEDKINKLQE